MNRIAFFILTFLALGVFAIVSFVITLFAWLSPSIPSRPKAPRVAMRLRDDDPVVLQLG